ncbi:hypothetical protein HWV62_1947 [Athelia sp. TMB]|nr:hypothetical protein HWV62_1947 [Athelia sp. TMB]
MTLGRYRWGRRARLTAGACIAIGMRESRKPDSILDIAYLIDETPSSVTRAFKKVAVLLHLEVPSSDATVHLPNLRTHLHSLLHPITSSSPMPSALVKQISALPLNLVMCTAASICDLLSRHTARFDRAATPPIACAVLILSLEAEVRNSITSLTEFARLLAARFAVGEGTVLRRYNEICDLIEEWIREVPWLDQFESKGKGKNKMSKRVIVARGIKDVVQFQEEIWKKKVEAQGKIQVVLDVQEEDLSDDDTASTTTGSSGSASKRGSEAPDDGHLEPARKRRKTKLRDMDEASSFLLRPLNSSLPAVADPSGLPPSSLVACEPRSLTTIAPASRATTPPPLPLLSYLLTASPSTISLNRKPSRLQLLISERARGVDDIADSELFAEGELESLMRSDAEVEALRVALEWPKEDTVPFSVDKVRDTTGSDKAFSLNTAHADSPDDCIHDHEAAGISDTAGLEIEAWRPLSPSGGGNDGLDRYESDEEY